MANSANESELQPPASPSAGPRYWRWIVALVCLLSIGLVYFFFGRHLSLDSLVAREEALRDFQQQHWLTAYAGAFVIYVVITGLSLPGAALLSLFYGWLFGPVAGVTLVSFASTLGATIAFSLSRYLFRDAVQRRYQQRLEKLNASIEAEGAYYLFTLRLIPVFPFFLVNLLMGLTPIRLWTFWWVSQLGMLAGTIVYVAAGASLPSMSAIQQQGLGAIVRWPTLVAFALLGALPLVTKQMMKRLRRSP
ncbi:TVP38/TMEM64 family protein [Blastopirellula sp. JC732]|uniref:TVP38/TMEM64 family membrane protein n=1 Tax=Blastopirellula sediminis TaxID=2894196 RepID=A0A9X1MLT0_9BACT|nr:TVP38/TMEM64 family protein [Blastopirellula sediminis]MCC9608541.1 TVP38/TMEM64 family protein [Blastopirellula sediminis]MCC9628682.1 TVP38/TMEM64 family protein [Blastopirellula sediminis]